MASLVYSPVTIAMAALATLAVTTGDPKIGVHIDPLTSSARRYLCPVGSTNYNKTDSETQRRTMCHELADLE